jgi:hypothetical protein
MGSNGPPVRAGKAIGIWSQSVENRGAAAVFDFEKHLITDTQFRESKSTIFDHDESNLRQGGLSESSVSE